MGLTEYSIKLLRMAGDGSLLWPGGGGKPHSDLEAKLDLGCRAARGRWQTVVNVYLH
jgi:hypothetical protein